MIGVFLKSRKTTLIHSHHKPALSTPARRESKLVHIQTECLGKFGFGNTTFIGLHWGTAKCAVQIAGIRKNGKQKNQGRTGFSAIQIIPGDQTGADDEIQIKNGEHRKIRYSIITVFFCYPDGINLVIIPRNFCISYGIFLEKLR